MLAEIDRSTGSAVLAGLALYLVVVRALRFRNLRALKSNYARYLQDPYAMDYKTALEILQVSILIEFPFMAATATGFALLKSFTIASGTRLLVQTRQLTAEKNVGKRTEDTGVVLAELFYTGIDTERGMRAISKMNWLHGRYGSKITNDEMIHTLSLFVLEPLSWIDELEWRPMIDLEKAAYFIYWKEIGYRMGMKSIPNTLDELRSWACNYEKTALYYADSNRQCMEATRGLLLSNVPWIFQGLAWNIALSLLEDHVRAALGAGDPPAWISRSVRLALDIRAACVRLLFLPRLHKRKVSVEDKETGRIYRTEYLYEPWYIKPTGWTWIKGVLGLNWKHMAGPGFKPNGYLPEELGPVEYEEKSRDSVLKEAAEMKEYVKQGGAGTLGCPFLFSGRAARS